MVYELAVQSRRSGGEAVVSVTKGLRNDYDAGDYRPVRFGREVKLPGRMLDIVSGYLGLPRSFLIERYRPVLNVIPNDFSGTLFLHNAPALVSLFKKERPLAKVCLYIHNELFRTYGTREARKVIGAVDCMVANSQFVAKRLLDRFPEAAGKVRVVHNGVDVSQFTPPASLPDKSRPVILYVGRIVPDKGVHLLIQAALELQKEGQNFCLRIVGSRGFATHSSLCRYEIALRKLGAPLGTALEFQESVGRAEVVEEYRRAAIFCAPAIWNEPFGMTIAEAMACGLPVVAARRGGIPEIGGEAILYFDPPAIADLVSALRRLLLNESERQEWGRRARARALSFSWESQFEKLCSAMGDPLPVNALAPSAAPLVGR